MKRDKVDRAVLRIMTDEQMSKYITSYGDRVAVLSFCEQTQCHSTNKETLLERLRSKIGARKMKSKTRGSVSGTPDEPQSTMARPKNMAAEKTSRRVEIGWLHFGSNGYSQVRTNSGGGTRHATFAKTTTVAQIMELGKELFFPDGHSTKGPAEDFTFGICDLKKNKIPLDITVGQMYEQTKLKLLRFYICTKEGASTDHSSEEKGLLEDEEDGCHSDDSITDLQDLSNSSDSDGGTQMQTRSKKRRAILQTETAQSPGPSHPFQSTPTDITNGNIGQRQNRSDLSLPEPLFEEADTLVWDSDDGVVVVNVNHVEGDDDVIQIAEVSGSPTQVVQLTFLSGDGLTGLDEQLSVHEEAVQTAQLDSELNLPSYSSSQISSTSSSNAGNPQTMRRASICRIKVVDDLLAVFTDSSIINVTLKMDFLNEKAVDNAGVSREVYTAFWEQFLEQCEGEIERVPRLRPAFSEAEWQAVGRIWVKGFLDHGVMPVKLSLAFILACISGIDNVDSDTLMSSFLNYLPPIERSAVEKALQGTLEESDQEDLLDLFTRMGSHSLPPQNGMKSAIEMMAHKAILQEPKYIVDCFSTPMSHVKLKLPDKDSVFNLYELKKPTGKRVMQLLETTKVVLSQREQATFNHLQRYVKNADQAKAEKILRFCTGSSVICVEKIMVSFNAETGLNRRPVAHTCGATLDVPCTYSSYPEFRTEFDNILSSNYLEMDII
uniref:Si:ch73-30l9.1 n=1 Tax=Iconisemion striatum TaxID=60296 RepID=A0A1A7Y3P9_9TELE